MNIESLNKPNLAEQQPQNPANKTEQQSSPELQPVSAEEKDNLQKANSTEVATLLIDRSNQLTPKEIEPSSLRSPRQQMIDKATRAYNQNTETLQAHRDQLAVYDKQATQLHEQIYQTEVALRETEGFNPFKKQKRNEQRQQLSTKLQALEKQYQDVRKVRLAATEERNRAYADYYDSQKVLKI